MADTNMGSGVNLPCREKLNKINKTKALGDGGEGLSGGINVKMSFRDFPTSLVFLIGSVSGHVFRLKRRL